MLNSFRNILVFCLLLISSIYASIDDDKVYFVANDGIHGEELWVHDGNETQIVFDMNKNLSGSRLYPQAVLNNKLIFTSEDSLYGKEFWEFDLDTNTSKIIKDINKDSGYGPMPSIVYKNKFYFTEANTSYAPSGYSGDGQTVMWEYDGENNPSLFQALSVSEYVEFQNKLYFIGRDLINEGNHAKSKAYVYDGVSNPQLATSLSEENNKDISWLIVSGGNLYYGAYNSMYRYDGTTSTKIEGAGGKPDPYYIVSLKGKEYMVFFKDRTFGKELYKIGENNVSLVADINPKGNSNMQWMEATSNHIYFKAYNGTEYMLYKYDGVSDPVAVVDENNNTFNAGGAFVQNNEVYFSSYSLKDKITTIYKYSGIGYPIATTLPPQVVENKPKVLNSTLFYRAKDNKLGIYDGNSSHKEFSVNDFTEGSGISSLFVFKNKLMFYSYDGVNGNYKSYNGEDEPNVEINSSINSPIIFNSKLYYFSYDENYKAKLYSYDGINAPSSIVGEYFVYNPSSLFPKASILYEFNSKLYFSAYGENQNDYELWSYDGINPPSEVKNINPNSWSMPYNYLEYKEELYFTANDGTHGIELFKVDKNNNVSLIKDIKEGSSGSNPSYLTVYKDKLYFSVSIDYKSHLYSYDGNTISSFDTINSDNPEVSNLKVFNNKLYFIASDGRDKNGSELWSYDGENDPILEQAITPTTNKGGLVAISGVVNNKLYFTADDGVNGIELWEYDGTTNPIMVKNIHPTQGINNNVPVDLIGYISRSFIFDSYSDKTFGESFDPIVLKAVEIDNNPISFSYSLSNNNILNISVNEDNVSLTHIPNAKGSVAVEINATSNGKTITNSFTISVNAKPSINFTDQLNLSQNELKTILLSSILNDSENDTLIVSAQSSDLNISKVSVKDGVLYIIPQENKDGNVSIDLSISDGYSEISHSIVLQISKDIPITNFEDVDILDTNFTSKPLLSASVKKWTSIDGVEYLAFLDSDNQGKLSIKRKVNGVWEYFQKGISDLPIKNIFMSSQKGLNIIVIQNDGSSKLFRFLKNELKVQGE